MVKWLLYSLTKVPQLLFFITFVPLLSILPSLSVYVHIHFKKILKHKLYHWCLITTKYSSLHFQQYRHFSIKYYTPLQTRKPTFGQYCHRNCKPHSNFTNYLVSLVTLWFNQDRISEYVMGLVVVSLQTHSIENFP